MGQGQTYLRRRSFGPEELDSTILCPRKRTKTNANQLSLFKNKVTDGLYRYLPEDKPEEWEQFKEYCIQDVVVERELRKRLMAYPLPETEKNLYYLDQRINDFGIKLDKEFVDKAIEIDTTYTDRLHNAFVELTKVENPKSVAQFKDWLSHMLGFRVKSVTKNSIPRLLEEAENQGISEVSEALRLRQEISKTSVSKYAKMDEVLNSDGRVEATPFTGANRGRWAGRRSHKIARNRIAF